jgi:hypothetical protein
VNQPYEDDKPPAPVPDPLARMRDALVRSASFSREQVAYLLSLALRSGDELADLAYRAGHAEGVRAQLDAANEDFRASSSVPIFSHREWLRTTMRAARRHEADVASVVVWHDDYVGGPAEPW